MSPSTDRRTRRGEDGFSLIEVMVALGITMTILVAVVPQLIVGIKAASRAGDITQAKGVAQGQIEQMRNLPFHVAPDAGDYIDVLDRYFPNAEPPTTTPVCLTGTQFSKPSTDWSGYVALGSSAKCTYEPSSGGFFRTVRAAPGNAEITIVTDTAFLSSTTPPVVKAPASTYDSSDNLRDAPVTYQLGITNTVLYTDHGTLHPVTTYTQLAASVRSPLRLQGKVNATAVELGSITPDPEGATLSLTAGLMNINGALSRASTLSTNVSSANAALSTGLQGTGAALSKTAPPAFTSTTTVGPSAKLGESCSYACWGQTSYGSFPLTASGGLPNAGTTTTPLQSRITSTDNHGFSFGNAVDPALYRASLGLTLPMASVDTGANAVTTPGCGMTAGGYAAGGGYLTTTPAGSAALPAKVDLCGAAAASTVSLFPTDFAPHGVVRVTLTKATTQCTVSGPTHTATTSYDYAAKVEYFNGTDYVAVPIVKDAGTDPLASVLDLTATHVKNPTVNPAGTRHLADYVSAWSSLTKGAIGNTKVPGTAKVSLPGIVRVVSGPVRHLADSTDPDPTSVISLTVGAVNCEAMDAR